MPYDGTGVFTLYATGNPVVTGTTISSTWCNNTLQDIANNGLSGVITKDGQTTVTANIPLASFRITGLGAATALTDATQATQVQNSSFTSLSSVSGTNTIVGTATPTPSAYAAGQEFSFTPANTNTGATTLNVSSLGAKNVYMNNAACTGGEIAASVPVRVRYDGTQFQIIGPFVGGTVPGAVTFSSHVTLEGVTSTGATGTGNLVFSASPTFTGTVNTAALTAGGVVTVNASDISVVNQSATNKDGWKVSTPNSYTGTALLSYSVAGGGTTWAHFRGQQGSGNDAIIVYGNGNIVNSNNSYGAISSRTIKLNIEPAGSQWDDVKWLGQNVSKFNLESDPDGPRQIGGIAEDIEQRCPGLIFRDANDVPGIHYSVWYMKGMKALGEVLEWADETKPRLDRVEAALAAHNITVN